MSIRGIDSYAGVADLPAVVRGALRLAREMGFESVCRVEQGRLLMALAAGAPESIGETGTGCGVGLAWLIAGRRAGVRLVTVERDRARAGRVAAMVKNIPDVEIIHADWTQINTRGPFDLLVLDGGGNGKAGEAADPARLLKPGGTLVIDDFTPLRSWPPMYEGALDRARLGWLEHPELLSTEVRVAPGMSTILGTRRPPPEAAPD